MFLRSAGIGLVIDVTQELPKNKYGPGVTVVKIAAADNPGQDLRSHFPVRKLGQFHGTCRLRSRIFKLTSRTLRH